MRLYDTRLCLAIDEVYFALSQLITDANGQAIFDKEMRRTFLIYALIAENERTNQSEKDILPIKTGGIDG